MAAVATLAGVLLAAAPSTSVALTATTYRIGDTTLRASAAGSYTGNAALVIAPAGAGVERAAADTMVAGRPETGVCFLIAAQAQERCIFVIASTSVSAVDTWTSAGWSRRYEDGQQLIIPATALVPVPFAVGR